MIEGVLKLFHLLGLAKIICDLNIIAFKGCIELNLLYGHSFKKYPPKKSELGFPANKGLKTGIMIFIALILMKC